jgi:hypothetical protein
MTPEKYENRITLFLDILGFRNVIEKRTMLPDNLHPGKYVDNPNGITELYNSLNIIREHFNIGVIPSENTKRITQFSDSLIISFSVKEKGEIFTLISDIHFLIKRFIKYQIICRGAISYGKLIHDEKFVFGPALNMAYETESKAAMYPRIIMDKTILKYASKYPDNELNSGDWEIGAIETLISKDSDDMYYIDYFEKARSSTFPPDISELQYYADLKKIIQDNINSTSPDIKVKYGWMRNKYNRMVDELKQEKLLEFSNLEDPFSVKASINLYQDLTKIE